MGLIILKKYKDMEKIKELKSGLSREWQKRKEKNVNPKRNEIRDYDKISQFQKDIAEHKEQVKAACKKRVTEENSNAKKLAKDLKAAKKKKIAEKKNLKKDLKEAKKKKIADKKKLDNQKKLSKK